jgi:CRISPR-associated exonuclease Cas4/CRISPR-associated protein Cas1
MTSPQLPLALPAPAANADELLIPARMINEWVYCPRLAFLEWAHGEWTDNADTATGRRAHLKSDTGRAPPLPAPEVIGEAPPLVTRRLLLGSESLGLTAEIDILEAEDGTVTPVDIKAGKRPHVAEGAHLPERVQVCVQGLLLREAGYVCEEGALWFAESRERVRVIFDEVLISETLRAASELRLAVAVGRLPPPLDHSPKCHRCSLMPVCLPDEVQWLRKGAIPRTPPPPASAALPLYVQTPGARVGKSGDALVVKIDGEADREIPFDEVSDLVLAGPVNLSTPALHELLRRETPVAFMSSGFWYIGAAGASGPRSSAARAAQFGFAADPARSLAASRLLVGAKIRNQRTILRRNWRGPDEARTEPLERLARLADRAPHAPSAATLLGLEGEAAQVYFRAFPALFGRGVAELPAFAFERRNRRPPADPVNACLSLCYALLARTMQSSLSAVGLDPWRGFYHVPRPGRPSLALDLMEPLRPILADSAVLMALNNGEIGADDFIHAAGGCNLKPAARKKLIAAYERRLDQETTHPVFGYQIAMRRMIHVQARLFARWLMGEFPDYPHYVPR